MYSLYPICMSDGIILHNRIERLRIRTGVSQTQLSIAAGVTLRSIIAIERDEVAPPLLIALRISRVLHASLRQVFFLVRETAQPEQPAVTAVVAGLDHDPPRAVCDISWYR